jgi:hypothetical protein
MLGFRQPMIDVVAGAGEFKSVRAVHARAFA